MAWEMNEAGALAADEKGNPVWINEAGEKRSVDYQAMVSSMQNAAKEAAQRKEKLREMEGRLAPFAHIEKPDEWMSEAQKALEMMQHAPDAQKDLEAQLQARLKPVTESYQAKLAAKEAALTEREKVLGELRGQIEQERVRNAFAQSPFVRDKLASHTLVARLYADRFALEEGQLVGRFESGDVIYGDDGSVASFDEALAKIVEQSPDKAFLLKGNDKAGSGAHAMNFAKPTGSKKSSRERIAEGLRSGQLLKQ